MLRTSKLSHDKRAIERTFVDGEKVFARNYSSVGKKWLPDKVISVAQHSVKVKLTSGLVIHHHFDQISKELLTNPQLSQCQSYTYIPVNSF